MRKDNVVLTLLGLVVVPVAAAHVEPSPEKVPAGSVSSITLSAEGEESVPAIKLTVQMGDGRAPTWSLITPGLEAFRERPRRHLVGREDPERRDREVRVLGHMPDLPGRVLVFPALVTYQDGKVVHWIGAASSDTPAPRVTLTAAPGQVSPQPIAPTTTSTEGDGGSSNTWIWILIVAAIGGALAAILVVRRRKRA